MPGDAYGQVTGIFLEQCHKGKPITVHGDGSQTRSFTWVEEAVEGIRLAGELDAGLDGSNLAVQHSTSGTLRKLALQNWPNCVCKSLVLISEIIYEEVGHPEIPGEEIQTSQNRLVPSVGQLNKVWKKG